MIGRVLIIAGSDSGGGAGIQADIRTVAALGGFPATAITALTAQNTLGVEAVQPVNPDFVRRQIAAVLDDIGADCVKTGMMVDASVVEAAADALERFAPKIPLVVDPVIASSSGTVLLDGPGVERLKRRFISRASVVMPNLSEAAMLTGLTVDSLDGMKRAADSLLRLGAQAVVVKGGHLPGDNLTDLVMTPRETFTLAAKLARTRSTHGTGCVYASAVACGLAQGLGLRRSVERAHAFVQSAIRNAPGLGKGRGPLGQGDAPGRKRAARKTPLRRRARPRRR